MYSCPLYKLPSAHATWVLFQTSHLGMSCSTVNAEYLDQCGIWYTVAVCHCSIAVPVTYCLRISCYMTGHFNALFCTCCSAITGVRAQATHPCSKAADLSLLCTLVMCHICSACWHGPHPALYFMPQRLVTPTEVGSQQVENGTCAWVEAI